MVHASESHTDNSLKTNMAFAKFLGTDVTFIMLIEENRSSHFWI